MNSGTKIRTILAILTTLNTVLAVTDVAQFGNEMVTFWYKIISVVINAAVVGINTYYNNDYTEEAALGTGYTRQLKAEKKENYLGEYFYEDLVDNGMTEFESEDEEEEINE